jgi:uncharacterized protein (UPF0548 family)
VDTRGSQERLADRTEPSHRSCRRTTPLGHDDCVTKRTDTRPLDARPLTYSAVGATAVADEVWSVTPAAFRRYEQTVAVRLPWEDARSLMLRWAVKTRSGFDVDAGGIAEASVREGANVWLRLAIGPVEVREPIRVIAVVDNALRCGFSYGTLDGHPVSGEEAFVVHRATEHGPVVLTIRSLTRSAPRGCWRYSFPILLVAQRFFRKRYLSSLK